VMGEQSISERRMIELTENTSFLVYSDHLVKNSLATMFHAKAQNQTQRREQNNCGSLCVFASALCAFA